MRDATSVPTDAAGERNPYVIASALRTLQVLHAFTLPPHRLGLAEVVAQLGLERNQAYRSLKTLEAGGFVVQGADARFEPGPAASALATAAMRWQSASVLEVARPYLDELGEATRETVHLFVRAGDRVVCVDRRESPQSVRLVSVLGRSLPLHAGAVPKAILAWLPAKEQDEALRHLEALPRYTDRTVRDSGVLKIELAEIRERGYSISDEDFDSSARGVGAPVFGAGGTVVGGISVGGPSFRVSDDTLTRFAQLVRAAAGEISRRMALAGSP